VVNTAPKDFSLFLENDYVLMKFLFLQHLSFSYYKEKKTSLDKFKEGYLSQKKRGRVCNALLHMAQDSPHK